MERQVYTGPYSLGCLFPSPFPPGTVPPSFQPTTPLVVTIGTTCILQLDHTPLATVDWTRGKHLTKARPIRVSIPGDWADWDEEDDKAFSAQVFSPGDREAVADTL